MSCPNRYEQYRGLNGRHLFPPSNAPYYRQAFRNAVWRYRRNRVLHTVKRLQSARSFWLPSNEAGIVHAERFIFKRVVGMNFHYLMWWLECITQSPLTASAAYDIAQMSLLSSMVRHCILLCVPQLSRPSLAMFGVRYTRLQFCIRHLPSKTRPGPEPLGWHLLRCTFFYVKNTRILEKFFNSCWQAFGIRRRNWRDSTCRWRAVLLGSWNMENPPIARLWSSSY